MSMAALCLAVRNNERTRLGLLADDNAASLVCDLAFEGYPHPGCGEKFYAVHDGTWLGTSADYDLSERMAVLVTITKRVGYTPKDRRATDAWAMATTGLNALCRAVIISLHHNEAVRNAANAIIGTTDAIGSGPNGFETSLHFQGASRVMMKGPEWFESPQYNQGKVADSVVAIAVTMTFGMADRIQGITGAT